MGVGWEQVARLSAPMAPEELRGIQQRLHWTNARTAQGLRCSTGTIEKWRSGSTPVPGPAAAALRLIVLVHDIPFQVLPEP